MKKAKTISLVLLAMTLWLTGCKATQEPSNAPAVPSSAASSENSNKPDSSRDVDRNSNRNTAPDKTASKEPPPKLEGVYEAREVRDKDGIVTMMSSISAIIYFSPDGTYSRVSERNGKIYHRDSGQFRIEAPDKVKLIIQMSDRKIQSPPVEKTHTYSLSSDGEQLTLTSKSGAVAIYRKSNKR